MVSGFRLLENQPKWMGSEQFVIDGRVANSDVAAWRKQGKKYELLRAALREALRERCQLALHERPVQASTLELVAAKGGPRLKVAAPFPADLVGVKLPDGGE